MMLAAVRCFSAASGTAPGDRDMACVVVRSPGAYRFWRWKT